MRVFFAKNRQGGYFRILQKVVKQNKKCGGLFFKTAKDAYFRIFKKLQNKIKNAGFNFLPKVARRMKKRQKALFFGFSKTAK